MIIIEGSIEAKAAEMKLSLSSSNDYIIFSYS